MVTHSAPVPSVEVTELPDDAYLLDVREPFEWAAGHAPDARHIPMSQLPVRAGEVPQSRLVHVVCKVGQRSAQVVAVLNANGWEAVNVEGGMVAWALAGRPMVSDSGAPPTVA
jgi:rhodanese-related sulfurtransferase